MENSEEVRSSSVQVAKLKIPRAKRLGLVVGRGSIRRSIATITLTCSEADPCDSGQRQHSAIPENLVPALISFRLGANGSRNLSFVLALRLIFSF